MSLAVRAATDMAYSGIQVSDWWGPAGTTASVIDVWHRPGSGIVGQAVDPPGQSSGASDQSSADPVVTMTLSPVQLALLLANYQIEYAGTGTAAGRPAEVVEVIRPDGRLAARYWLDSRTKLPLRRQIFDSSSRLVSDITLMDLKLGAAAVAAMPAVKVRPWTRQLDGSDLAALQRRGWPLPGKLTGGLRLYAASETSNSSGKIVDLSYSDGLSVVSLFVQRGSLPKVLKGWRRIAIAGHGGYSSDPDDRTVTWSMGGFVYTVIADAPVATVDRAVATIASDAEPSFWARLGRGFRRLAHLANPFR